MKNIGYKYNKLWLWFCIELVHSSVRGIYISEERNMLVAEKFIRSLVDKYGKHTVYTDGGTWYDEACNIIGLKHYLHSPLEKSLMESNALNNLGKHEEAIPCFDKAIEIEPNHAKAWNNKGYTLNNLGIQVPRME